MALPIDGGGYFAGNLRASMFNSIGLYQALITVTTDTAPVATVLSNNLGVDVVWSFVTTGIYRATATGALTASKTGILLTPDTKGDDTQLAVNHEGANSFLLYAREAGTLTDDLIAGTYLEIKVFP